MLLQMLRFLLVLFLGGIAYGEPARIRVFVALADNAAQGIVPVPAKIGNGNDAQRNLYWGCSEALSPVFKASRDWKFISTAPGPKDSILERATFRHVSGKYELIADAYRGTAIMECTIDFFQTLGSDEPVERVPLVAYIGHDALMEYALPEVATAKRGPGRAAVVLCCTSRVYFGPYLEAVNARPLLLTTQLMYPGGFLLEAALKGWIAGERPQQIRERAAAAYARNQKISLKAARSVFVAGDAP
jgi:hypothetical protein